MMNSLRITMKVLKIQLLQVKRKLLSQLLKITMKAKTTLLKLKVPMKRNLCHKTRLLRTKAKAKMMRYLLTMKQPQLKRKLRPMIKVKTKLHLKKKPQTTQL